MSWLKKIFGSSQPSPETPSQEPSFNLEDSVDMEFIDCIYFKDDQSKSDYINAVKSILKATVANDKIERVVVSEYLSANEHLLDYYLIMEAIIYDGYDNNGKLKLNEYYKAFNICRHNVLEKVDNNCFDFSFEESLCEVALKFDHRNYVRIETLFILGESFKKAGNLEKMNYYFNIIGNDQYDLSGDCVSGFHRQVGDIFLQDNEKHEALKWYKSGLQLNPKLGVKRQVASLENELNDN